MTLLFRLLVTCLAAALGKRLSFLDESCIGVRVWPNDIDWNGHMSNGRYLAVMDLGRVDLVIRQGLLRKAWKRGWSPIVGASAVRYRRSLKLFRRYVLKTRIVHWDDKWFYFEQRFERAGEVVAIGLVKGLMRARQGSVAAAEVLEAVGFDENAPLEPPSVRALRDMDGALS